jgi:hypothetical protein
MDQDRVFRQLDGMVTADGVVAIFGDNSFWVADSDWKSEVRAVVQDFLGEQRRAGKGVFNHHDKPYSEIVAESPFSEVEEITIPVQRTWTTATILGYLCSTSFAAKAPVRRQAARLRTRRHLSRTITRSSSGWDAGREPGSRLPDCGGPGSHRS